MANLIFLNEYQFMNFVDFQNWCEDILGKDNCPTNPTRTYYFFKVPEINRLTRKEKNEFRKFLDAYWKLVDYFGINCRDKPPYDETFNFNLTAIINTYTSEKIQIPKFLYYKPIEMYR